MELSKLGLLKDFGRLLYYRSFFKRGCIHNYTDLHLSRRIKCSVSKARVLRLFWVNNGWCRFEGKKLVFNSARNSVRGDKWHKSVVTVYSDINKTVNELYFHILANKNKQFEFLKQIAVAISKPSNYRQLKWGKGRLRKLGSDRLPKTSDRFKISYKGLGKVLGCSAGKAHALIKTFIQEHRLTAITSAVQVFGGESDQMNGFVVKFVPNSFKSRKYVYKALCNEYVFN